MRKDLASQNAKIAVPPKTEDVLCEVDAYPFEQRGNLACDFDSVVEIVVLVQRLQECGHVDHGNEGVAFVGRRSRERVLAFERLRVGH
jgi:hypothetical protein